MSDSRPCSLDVSPGAGPLAHRFPGFLWAAAVVWLVAMNAGCTSSLTAIALRDAMREIAEYGRRGEKAVEEADDRQLADDADPENLMSLEEALDSAVTRLAAVGRLDAEARQMLLETLESTSQEDWPIVIESFASSLEEIAKGNDAIEQVAETLEAEADDAVVPEDEVPADALVAVVDSDEMPAEETVAAVDPEEMPAEEMVAAVDPEEVTELAEAAETSDVEAVVEPPAETISELTAPVEEPAEPSLIAVSDTDTAAEAQPEASTSDASPGLLADRVTSAIRELPVSETPALSPVETMQRLEEALAVARRQAPLRVGNPCFAWQVRAWGDVERCDVSRFHTGQQVIVYFEVENLTSDVQPDGHATKLDTELRLVNVSGECLHEWSFPPLAESCPAPRRDYFARYILEVPDGIAPGPLRLEMTVNDLLGQKSADVALPLEVVGAADLPDERVASGAALLR
ncbi:MAG: hypothetical protein ISQ70_00525 [Pirellulales bacterium]|nr:hypothetical protein [Pirellulales bacterium]